MNVLSSLLRNDTSGRQDNEQIFWRNKKDQSTASVFKHIGVALPCKHLIRQQAP
jgi:hypothetical protein